METATIYHNATVFTGVATEPTSGAFMVRDGRFEVVGNDEATVTGDAELMNLHGAFVMPGFVEGHVHMMMLGESLDKVPLRDCSTIEEVQERLLTARATNPMAERLLGVGWRFEIFSPGETPTTSLLDEVIDDIPVVLDANDLHSAWANTAGLRAMGITRETADPIGGQIVRDENGDATGFLLEAAAFKYAWGYLASVSTDGDRDRFLDNAFRAYIASGVTSAADMSFNDSDLTAFRRRLDRDGRLPFPVDAYWLLPASGNASVDRAEIERIAAIRDDVQAAYGSNWLRILGVKFILDGVIDACTAAMRVPYVNGANPGPIWERELAVSAAIVADAHELELALHAIGDEASTIAMDMVDACQNTSTSPSERRPRLEHLEYVADDTIARMAKAGVTASVQPVHSDPAVLDNWKAMLGHPREELGFPWHKLRQAGVPIALGTDAPTAPHQALRNLFIALTARSALDPDRDPYHPERVFAPTDALDAHTRGGARASHRDGELGRIARGYRANFCIMDVNPCRDDPDALMRARVLETFVDGRRLFALMATTNEFVADPSS